MAEGFLKGRSKGISGDFFACEKFHKPVISAAVKRRQEPGSSKEMGEGYVLVSLGMTFALTLTGAALLGFWADRKLGTMPLFTLVGTFGGMGLAGFWLWQKLGQPKRDGSGD